MAKIKLLYQQKLLGKLGFGWKVRVKSVLGQIIIMQKPIVAKSYNVKHTTWKRLLDMKHFCIEMAHNLKFSPLEKNWTPTPGIRELAHLWAQLFCISLDGRYVPNTAFNKSQLTIPCSLIWPPWVKSLGFIYVGCWNESLAICTAGRQKRIGDKLWSITKPNPNVCSFISLPDVLEHMAASSCSSITTPLLYCMLS